MFKKLRTWLTNIYYKHKGQLETFYFAWTTLTLPTILLIAIFNWSWTHFAIFTGLATYTVILPYTIVWLIGGFKREQNKVADS